LEQTSSAKPAVWWASVERVGRIFVERDFAGRSEAAEERLGAGEAAADNFYFFRSVI